MTVFKILLVNADETFPAFVTALAVFAAILRVSSLLNNLVVRLQPCKNAPRSRATDKQKAPAEAGAEVWGLAEAARWRKVKSTSTLHSEVHWSFVTKLRGRGAD